MALKEEMPAVCAVLPAAGVGERMSLSCPKQFCNVFGRPLISYTIESFEKIPWIVRIVVVVSNEYLSHMEEILETFSHKRVTLVEGSSTRHRSIYNGVLAVSKACSGDPHIVVIHDAVRPFLDEHTVRTVAEAALQFGAAGVVRPLVSTVVATDMEGFLDHSLDRSKYRSSEMPQAFTLDVILKAYEKCTDYDLDYGTECLHLAQRYGGVKVQLIDGPENLWKVTYRRDLYALEGTVKAKSHVCLVFCNGTDVAAVKGALEQSLLSKHGNAVSLHVCNFDELDNLGSDSEHLMKSFVIFHGNCCSAEGICASTDDVILKIRQSSRLNTIYTLVHLVVSDSLSNESILTVMSSVRKGQGSGRLVNAVLSNVEGLSKASDIISSLVMERNQSFDGQTFVV